LKRVALKIDDISSFVRGFLSIDFEVCFTNIVHNRRSLEMTKTELIDKVAESAGMTKKDAGAAVTAVFEAITGALVGGDKVQLIGFGSFEVRDRAARDGHDPQDPKKVIHIPARKVPVFKAGKALKDSVL
jgi:DNA-binding protein HU-beta